MRVAYIINNQYPGDGVGNSIVELVRLLLARGDDVRVLHERHARPPQDLRERFTRLAIKHLRDGGRSPAVREATAHWRRADLVLVDYSLHYSLAEALALPHPGIKAMVYHGITPPDLWPDPKGRVALSRGLQRLQALLEHADYAIVASHFSASELTDRGMNPARVAVLPYCVPAERFYPRPKDLRLQTLWGLSGKFVLLYAGRMAGNKRIATLVHGLAAVRRSGMAAKLLLVGNDQIDPFFAEAEAIRRLAESLGIGDDVVFTGPVTEEVLPHCYNLADAYVSASVHEGFGLPAVEAMACAKPVVAARAAAVPEVVGDAGRWFEPDDASGMANAVSELFDGVQPANPPESPPRVCFVVPRYGLGFAGGAEALCRRWAETCQGAGWAVQVVTTTSACMIDWRNHFSPGPEIVAGVRVERFAVDRSMRDEHFSLHAKAAQVPQLMADSDLKRWLASGIGRPLLFEWLARNRDEFDFFVFLPYLFNTSLLGSEMVRGKAVLIPCLHDEGHAYTDVVRRMLNGAAAIFFNTPAERDLALGKLRVVNPNCFTLGMEIDPLPGDADRFRSKYRLTDPFLLYCGRLETGKNIPLLAEYYARYQAVRRGPLKLVLCGTGAPPQAAGVLALGYLPDEDKRGAMAAAAALVNPSVNESFSIVLMESWAQGRPALVHGACPVTATHIQRSGGGWCFSTQAEFDEAVDQLMNDPDEANRRGAQGREYVAGRYDGSRLLERFRQCLDLVRTTTPYERTALHAVARAREFDRPRYVERWEKFLKNLVPRWEPSRSPSPDTERPLIARQNRNSATAP